MDGFSTSVSRGVATLLVAGSVATVASNALASPMAMSRDLLRHVAAHDVMQGIASFYDDPGLTSSGETYDATLFTAAIQIDLRDQIGGVRYGRKYRPVYGVAEYGGKRAVLKFNDVGPLKPGRKFDLSRAAMAHFGGIELGLLPEFKVMMLPPGRDYTLGPVQDEVTEREVRELLEAEARQLAPVEAIETVIAGSKTEELHSDSSIFPPHVATDDDLVTAALHAATAVSAIADPLDGSFDTTVFDSL